MLLGSMLSMAQTSDGKYIVSAGGKDAFIKLFNLEDGEMVDRIAAYNESTFYLYLTKLNLIQGQISTIAVSNNNKYVATGSDQGVVRIYNFKTKLLHHEFKVGKKSNIYFMIIITISD